MSRPIWKGSISFGLVNIPVQLETAVREKSVSFHMLSKDGSCRLRRKLYCPETGEEFEYNDTTRGVEVSKDRYVVVDEKEIEAVKPVKARAIEIEQFVGVEEIDPIYFDRPYFITPTDGSAKAYKLLHEAMKQSGKAGLARFVMRDRQNLALIRVVGDGLVLQTMHFADEVLSLEDSLPATLERAKTKATELKTALQLVEAMTKELDLASYKDEYRHGLETLIDQKKGKRKTVAVSDDHDEEVGPPTINLMEALKRSLAAGGGRVEKGHAHARRPRRKSA